MDSGLETSFLPDIVQMISVLPERCDTMKNIVNNVENHLTPRERAVLGDRLTEVIKQCLITGEKLGILQVGSERIRLPFNIRPNNIPDFTANMSESEAEEEELSQSSRQPIAKRTRSSYSFLATELLSESSEGESSPAKQIYRSQGNNQQPRAGGRGGGGCARRRRVAKRGSDAKRGRSYVQSSSGSSSFEENGKSDKIQNLTNNNMGRSTTRKDKQPERDNRNLNRAPRRRPPVPHGRPRIRHAPNRRAARERARRRQARNGAKKTNARLRRHH